jgi:DNA (cytosine-5)-methyltransferase 1
MLELRGVETVKILNLYAGLGGNRKLWGEEHEITAVEMDEKIAGVYKANFPRDTVVIGDAHQYLIDNSDEFDFIWSSPPCQTHSRMMKATRHKRRAYPDLALYEEVLFLKNFFSGGFVVENVIPYYEPLINPDARIGRHIFWSNFEINEDFKLDSFKVFINAGTSAESEKLKEWLCIKYDGNIYYKGNHCPGQVLRNCVHPNMGKYILECYKDD